MVGASGTGKSTLLFNLIRQDIAAGEGVAVLDPHGDLVDQILGVIPLERIDDVILIDPSDEEFSIGFNILSAHADWEKTLLASDLVSVFRRLSTAWGDQMGSVLSNAILAFLESTKGGTLAELRRFLLEPKFRDEFLATVRDPDIVYYWKKGFSQLTGNKSIGPVLTRLDTFLSPKPIRYMVSQSVNRLDFGQILDSGKIFLAKLSQGMIGQENAHLLGSLLMAKFQQTAMARQRQQTASRRNFWLYLDECHHFITPSTAEILSGARKYRVGLTLAHQEMRHLQRDPELASAVMTNCSTRICFRVGDQDARSLESGFSHFEARDLQNLGTGEAVCRVERSDWDFNLQVALPECPDDSASQARRQAATAASREKYATPRAVVETDLRKRASPDVTEAQDAELPTKVRPTKPTAAPKPPVPKGSNLPPLPTVAPEMPPLVTTGPPPPAVLEAEAATKPVEPLSAISAPVLKPAAPLTDEVAAVPNPGVPEGQRTVPTAPTPEPPPLQPIAMKKPEGASPNDLGRGGAQHQAVQLRIKDGATALGFRVVLEKPVLDGAGMVDLVIEREDFSMACEVTVENTIDYEVKNVLRCMKAGFTRIAVVGVNEAKLGRLEVAVRHSLGPDDSGKVSYFLPDAFLEFLRQLPASGPVAPKTKTVKGYKVKSIYDGSSPEEYKAKEERMIRLISDEMRKKNRRKT